MSTEAQKRAWKKYYDTKVKPKRQKKSSYAAYGKYRCPLCSTHRFMRDFDGAPYSFDAMKIAFTGHKGIKIEKNITQYNTHIHEIMRQKVIELVHLYNLTSKELKLPSFEAVLIRVSSQQRENSQKRLISPILLTSQRRIGGIR